ALGLGIARPGPVSVVLGTSGVVFAVLPEYTVDPLARLHVFCHAIPQRWHAMGVMLSAAGSAAWLHGVLGADFRTLDTEAAGWDPGAEGLLFAPYLAGERTPHPDADIRGAFVGVSASHARRRRFRAARLARAAPRARREARGRPRVGRRRAQRAVAARRRLRPRAAARADRVRGGLGIWRRHARRGPRRHVRRRRRGRL